MVKPNDQFWIFVEQMNDGLSKCRFCGYVFAVDTSISRIKSHLSGVKGCGVNLCEKVPADVQEAAYLAIHGTNKKLKAMPSSSYDEANDTTSASTSSQEQNNEVEMLERDLERVPMEVQGIEQEAGEQRGFSLEETGYEREHMTEEMMQPMERSISAEGLVLDHDAGETRKEEIQAFHELHWLYHFSC